jgi:hypothetical protein
MDVPSQMRSSISGWSILRKPSSRWKTT